MNLSRRNFLGFLVALPLIRLPSCKRRHPNFAEIPIDQIKIRNNLRTRNPNQKELVESIRKIGLMNPIIIRRNFEVFDGNYRLEACRQLGIKKVPVHFIDMSDEQLNYYRSLV